MAVLFLLSYMVLLFGHRLALASVISPSNGSFCNDGTSREFSCEVNGTTLVWSSGSNSATFGSAFTTPAQLGPYINTHFVSAGNGMVVANATVTGSPGLNRTTLECRNSLGVSATTARAFITYVVASSGATSIDFQYLYNNMINIAWEGATCVQFYNISDEPGSVVATTSNLSYIYTFREVGVYNFEVMSIGYTGNIIGVISKTFHWQPYAFSLILNFLEKENKLIFTIQGHRINQPPINDCTITIESVTVPCTNSSASFNVMLSSDTNIAYNLTVVNDAGVSSDIQTLSGDLLRLMNVTRTIYNTMFVTVTPSMSMGPGPGEDSSPIIGDPVVFVVPFIVLGILIISSIGWIMLMICWKRQCCCPRIWRSSFWLIFFCYDCCTYDTEEKEGNTIGLKNPNVVEEKGNDTPL